MFDRGHPEQLGASYKRLFMYVGNHQPNHHYTTRLDILYAFHCDAAYSQRHHVVYLVVDSNSLV